MCSPAHKRVKIWGPACSVATDSCRAIGTDGRTEQTRHELETCFLILVQIRNPSPSPWEINHVHLPTEQRVSVAVHWRIPLADCALADELLTVIGLSWVDQQNTGGTVARLQIRCNAWSC